MLSEQSTISKSTTESKYRGLAVATVDLTWIQFLYRDLDIPTPTAPILWLDNIGATYLSANPIFHAMNKQVEIDFHFVKEKVAHKDLDIRFISSLDPCFVQIGVACLGQSKCATSASCLSPLMNITKL